jgi:hypothetical protein
MHVFYCCCLSLFHSEEYHRTLFFPITASQFEEEPQSCHQFGEELLDSLKKCHSVVVGLEEEPLLNGKTALAENYRLGNLFFSHLHFYLLWILLKIIYIIWSFEI